MLILVSFLQMIFSTATSLKLKPSLAISIKPAKTFAQCMDVLKQRYSLDQQEMQSSFIRSHAMKVHQNCAMDSQILMAIHQDKIVGSVELVTTKPVTSGPGRVGTLSQPTVGQSYHLQNLVVDASYRRSGIATKVLN